MFCQGGNLALGPWVRGRSAAAAAGAGRRLVATERESRASHLDDDYQLMQRSALPTMYFQRSLPRLPIPSLEKTCDRYLRSLEPLLIEESYRKTADVVTRFRTGSGLQLQKMLKEKDLANKETSYISEPWFDMYLRDRAPLPVNYNPLMAIKSDPRPEYNDQLVRSANIVISALRFMRSLRQGCLEPEVFHLNPSKSDNNRFRMIMKLCPSAFATYAAYTFKAFPLDMSQYNGLFGATRIPELDKDRIYRTDKSKHILVMRKGRFFAVDVLDDDGNIEPPHVILSRLKEVLTANIKVPEHPLGVLTAANRDIWASLRHHLIEIGNEQAMKQIDSGLFCLCLDDTTTFNESSPIPFVRDFLAGDAVNRWFDKSFSLLVAKDGTTAVNFEHSWGDGVAVLRLINELYDETTKSPLVDPNVVPNDPNSGSGTVREITVNLDDRMKSGIAEVSKTHNDTMNSLDINYHQFTDVNKNFCKTNRVSPDGTMQLAFQLASRQLLGKYVSTYESCSTAAFRHGRTETMRPCTTATKEFCDAILLAANRPSPAELRAMIDKCSTIHGNLTKEAAMGQGFDRHLFGLRHIAEVNGIKQSGIFQDASYQLINHNILSTSTLSSPGLLLGAFGPVVKDGFGVGYFIQNDEGGCMVSSYKGKQNGAQFVDCLKSSLATIRDAIAAKK